MEWFISASWRLWRHVLVADLPPICFRVVSWVPQNGFVGRLTAWRLRRRHSGRSRPLGGVFQSAAGGVFGGEAVDTGAETARQCCRRSFSAPLGFPRFPAACGSTGNVKIACLAPFVALR